MKVESVVVVVVVLLLHPLCIERFPLFFACLLDPTHPSPQDAFSHTSESALERFDDVIWWEFLFFFFSLHLHHYTLEISDFLLQDV